MSNVQEIIIEENKEIIIIINYNIGNEKILLL